MNVVAASLECAQAYENEITKLRETIAEQAVEIKTLEIEFGDVRDSFLYYKEMTRAQAAVIESLKSALTYVIEDLELRASLKEDEDERGVVDIGDGAYRQAKEALSIPTDSTQILAEVRKKERKRVAKVCDEFHTESEYPGFKELSAAIRAME